ncbi:MAG: hypothetical protein JWM90_1039 [Thermoleophilia bacterium]|nr:hypothetical protein [Thermoleophilia bacterium]
MLAPVHPSTATALLLALLLLVALAAASAASAGSERVVAGPSPVISSLAVAKPSFSPRASSLGGGRVAFSFQNAGQQKLRVRIVDATGAPVRELADSVFGAGETKMDWDGLASTGLPAPDGAYQVVVETTGGAGPQQQLAMPVTLDSVPAKIRLLRSAMSMPSPRVNAFAIQVALTARSTVRVSMSGDAGRRTKTFHAGAGKQRLVMHAGKRNGLSRALRRGRANVNLVISVWDAAGNRFVARPKLALLPPGTATGDTPRVRGEKLSWPVWGPLSSTFGRRWGRQHQGIDLSVPTGRVIGAVANGRVRFAGSMSGYGNTVIIDHGRGISTLYAHQSRIATRTGARVLRGQKIGYVGSTGSSTGAHLHFEVHRGGSPRNPMGYMFRL